MCDPITGFAIASAGSGALSAFGAARDSEAKKKSLEYQASIARQNKEIAELQAKDALEIGKEEADQNRRSNVNLKSSIKAQQGASGLRSDDSDAMDILISADVIGLAERGIILDNADKQAWTRRVQASNFDADASVLSARAGAENPLMAGVTSLLGSGMNVASKWYGAKL